ncbi:Sec-independent protein translocase family protein [Acetobacter senegalensis]|uniref:hypothetical protein n=1 Tax=Acetobacter senegalensis TaxID=446692 RepID=UPI00264BF187|nr:hypothetical protein [Acetobacter senegalensis]MDN7349999.1 hypothetical protein [Acetobacter senegalensis]
MNDEQIAEDRKRLAALSNDDLVSEFKRRGETLAKREYNTEGLASVLSNRLDNKNEGKEHWEATEKTASVVREMRSLVADDYTSLRNSVVEMKSREDLKIKDEDLAAQFDNYRKFGVEPFPDAQQTIDRSLSKFEAAAKERGVDRDSRWEAGERQQQNFNEDYDRRAQDRNQNQTGGLKLGQTERDHAERRDDAKFLGREAAHVLPQGERDRQRDEARLANPAAKRDLGQKLEPEAAMGGDSKKDAPVSALGKMAAAREKAQQQESKSEAETRGRRL